MEFMIQLMQAYFSCTRNGMIFAYGIYDSINGDSNKFKNSISSEWRKTL